jgi:hypothetical protein
MKAKWITSLMVVSCLHLFAARSGAQSVPEAERGEAVLVGYVLSVDVPNNSIVMAVREYTAPPGGTFRLSTPRAVVVQIGSGVPIHVRWNPSQPLTFNDVQPGVNIVACGPNRGLALPLQANNIALWTHVRSGIFMYGPAQPMPPGGMVPSGDSLIPLPPVAPSAAPKPTPPKAPASKTGKPAAKPKSGSRR